MIAIDPVQQYDEFKAPPTGQERAPSGDVGLLRGGGSGRYQFWETAVNAFASAPIGGVGASGYTPVLVRAPRRSRSRRPARPLGSCSRPWPSSGSSGFALLRRPSSAPPWSPASAAPAAPERGRSRPAPALALLVVGLAAAAVDWTWDLPAVFVVDDRRRGAAHRAGDAVRPGPGAAAARARSRSRRRVRGAASALLLVAWVSICASGLLMLSAHALDSSREAAARRRRRGGALSAANDAIDLQPWAADPRTQLALVYEQAGDYDEAREAIDEAISRSPDDYRLRLLAARMAVEDGDNAAARGGAARGPSAQPARPRIIQAEVGGSS